jgi:hypothetical protein
MLPVLPRVRPTPAPMNPQGEAFDPEEDEPVLEVAWPYIQVQRSRKLLTTINPTTDQQPLPAPSQWLYRLIPVARGRWKLINSFRPMHTSNRNRHLRSPSGAAVSSIPWAITTMPETAITMERMGYGSYTAGLCRTPLGGSAQFGRGQSTQFGGPAQPRANKLLTVSTPGPRHGRRSAHQLSSTTAATTNPTTAYARHLPVDISKRPKHTHSLFRRPGNRCGVSGSDYP